MQAQLSREGRFGVDFGFCSSGAAGITLAGGLGRGESGLSEPDRKKIGHRVASLPALALRAGAG